MAPFRPTAAAFAIPAFLWLAGCGGGGKPDAVAAPKPDDTPLTSAAPVAAPAMSPHASGTLSNGLAAKTAVSVDLMEVVDSETVPSGSFIRAVVPEDVAGADGKVAVPAGSHAVLRLADSGKNGPIAHLALSLYSVDVEGRQRMVGSIGGKQPALLTFQEDSSRGDGHRNVHLAEGMRLKFVLDAAVQMR